MEHHITYHDNAISNLWRSSGWCPLTATPASASASCALQTRPSRPGAGADQEDADFDGMLLANSIRRYSIIYYYWWSSHEVIADDYSSRFL